VGRRKHPHTPRCVSKSIDILLTQEQLYEILKVEPIDWRYSVKTTLIRTRHTFRRSIAILALGALLAPACGSDAPASTLDAVIERGYSNYGLEAQYVPFGFRDEDNNIIGFDIDVGDEIGERLGIEMRPFDTGWATVIQTLNDGGFDFILGGMTATADRAERVDFGVAYAEQASALLLRIDDDIEDAKTDLEGRIVSAGEGTPSIDMLVDNADQNGLTYDGEIQRYDDDATAFEALAAGRVDAYATSYVSLVPLMEARPGEFRAIMFRPDGWPDFYAAMAFRPEDDSFREAIDEVLLDMKADGTLAALQLKWFGVEMTTPDTAPKV
jgi:polar amino acid transport system substrate-binding protein